MTTPSFQPADGQKARWRHCYDLVAAAEPGDDVTYQQVMELLDCDRQIAMASMLEAKKHLEQDGQRTVRNVRRFGWIVCDAKANLDEADGRIRKTSRALERAARLVLATPRAELSRIDQSRLDFQQRSIIGGIGIQQRKSKSCSELLRESKKPAELPFRQSKEAS